jgi:hypothetical protein
MNKALPAIDLAGCQGIIKTEVDVDQEDQQGTQEEDLQGFPDRIVCYTL